VHVESDELDVAVRPLIVLKEESHLLVLRRSSEPILRELTRAFEEDKMKCLAVLFVAGTNIQTAMLTRSRATTEGERETSVTLDISIAIEINSLKSLSRCQCLPLPSVELSYTLQATYKYQGHEFG
jgi:hypothetical protein